MLNQEQLIARRNSLIEKTRLRLEEWTRGEDTDFLLEDDKSFYPITKYVNEYLDEAATKVLSLMPHHRLGVVAKDFDLTDFKVEKGIGYIPIPSDFIKVFGIRMSDWEREIAIPLKITDEEYKIQQHRFSRGIQSKPHIAVAFGNVEIYSCKDTYTSENVVDARYIGNMKAEELPDTFDDFVTLMCAAIVEEVFGNSAQSQILEGQLNTMMEIKNI